MRSSDEKNLMLHMACAFRFYYTTYHEESANWTWHIFWIAQSRRVYTAECLCVYDYIDEVVPYFS
jgi:hypothetical protein